MTVVIDTNVLLPMLCPSHPDHAILKSWARGEFAWALTTEILLEYEEIIRPRIGEPRWQLFLLLMEQVKALHQNVLRIAPSFHFHLITADPDDDKFADCAITAHADYMITQDKHFQPWRRRATNRSR